MLGYIRSVGYDPGGRAATRRPGDMMRALVALPVLVALVLGARLVDVLATLVGARVEAVDWVDAWFRNSRSRLVR